MNRQVIATLIALGSLLMGFIVRRNAESWSRNFVTQHGSTKLTPHYDVTRHLFLMEIGILLLVFGTILGAMLLAQWAARETRREPLGRDGTTPPTINPPSAGR